MEIFGGWQKAGFWDELSKFDIKTTVVLCSTTTAVTTYVTHHEIRHEPSAKHEHAEHEQSAPSG